MISAAGINVIPKKNVEILFNHYGENLSSIKKENVKEIGKSSDDYYAQWNKIKFSNGDKGLGIGGTIALFEIFIASWLGYKESSPATITNFLTTLSENFQVLIAGLERAKVNPNKIKDPVEKEKAEKELIKSEEKREGWIAGIIGGGGAIGLFKWAKEMFDSFKGNEKEDEDKLSLTEKIGLTAGSIVSAGLMGMSYTEKMLMSILSKRQNGGLKAKRINLDAKSDLRTGFDWLAMAAFIWVKKFKLPKLLIDLALPLSALHDWARYLIGKQLNKNDQSESVSGFKKFLKKTFSINGNGEEEISTPRVVANKLFLGNKEGGGIRSKYLTPLYKLFGCDPLNCYIKEDNKIALNVDSNEMFEKTETNNYTQNDFLKYKNLYSTNGNGKSHIQNGHLKQNLKPK